MACDNELQSDIYLFDQSADPPVEHASSSTTENTNFNKDQRIDGAIRRGQELQKTKRISFRSANTSLHVLNDENPSKQRYRNNNKRCSPYPRKPLWSEQTFNSNTHFSFKRGRSSPHVTRSTSPTYATHSTLSKANTSASMKGRRRALRCPLRIAELATPTKRHCIDTWRDRHEMLPCHMLERLKQNVMNQKVLATIPDAVNCFKIHKNDRASNVPSPKSRNQNPKKTRKESKEMTEVRLMSAVFAHQVATHLVKPMNLFMPEELIKLADTVSEEIKELIQNRRVCADYVYDRNLLKEMSGKITLWVAEVLACAQYKLIEDELRALKTQENKISKEGDLVTLIDQYVRWQMEENQDLEEEEGPALDALETLVDNVLDICLPKTDSSSLGDDQKMLPEIGNDHEDQVEDINMISDENYSQLEQINQNETANNIPDINGVYDIPEHSDKADSDDESDSKYDSTVEADSNASNAGDSHEHEGHTNVSDVNTTEEPLDDRKKVKFTQNGGRSSETGGNRGTGGIDDTGGNGESRGYGNTGRYGASSDRSDNGGRPISNDSLGKWPNYSHSATFIRSDIVFQPPNPSILSVVDESWPDDNIPTLKPSASVLKSVTSLGDIKEVEDEIDHLDHRHKRDNEAKQTKDHQNQDPYSNYDTDKSRIKDDGNNLIRIIKDKQLKRLSALEFFERNEEKGTDTSSSASSSKILNKEDANSSDTQKTRTKDPDLLWQVTPSKLLRDLQALISEQAEQIRETQIEQNNYIAEAESINDGKGDYKDTQNANQDGDTTDAEKNQILQAIKDKLKNETKFDYRVRPQTAPAWVPTSASEESMAVTRKNMRLGTNDLRKWCKDLENTLINLDQWKKWLDAMCKNIVFMQEETATCKKMGPLYRTRILKEWCKFKKNIDRDALLWRKLNQQTLKVLSNYPTKSQNTSRKLAARKKIIDNKKGSLSFKNEPLSLCKTISGIERVSAWLHRSIVSTEHVVKCNCHTLSKPRCSGAKKQLKNWEK